MATINLGTAILELASNTARLQGDLGKALKSIDRFARGANTLLAGIGSGISVAGVTAVIKGAINAADSLSELQKRTGVAANELLVLQGAASRGGVGMEAVSDVASKLSRRMAEAQHGTGDAANAFKAMGVSVTNASGNLKGVDQILGEVGKKFQGYEDGANKAALATAALGKGGDALIPMLETIDETRKRFEELGITISQDTLEAANKFNDTMDDVKDVMGVMASKAAASLLPTLQNIANMFVDAAKDSETFGIALKGIEVIIKSVTSFIVGLGTVITALGVRIGALRDAAALLGEGRFADAWGTIKKGAEDAEKVMLAGGKAIKQVWDDTAKSVAKVAPRRIRIPAPRLPSTAKPDTSAQDALVRLAEQRAKRELDIIKRANDQRQQLLDRSYQDNLVSHNQYFTQRIEIARASLDAELAVLEREARRQEAILKKAKAGSKEHTNATGDLEETLHKRNELLSTFGQLVKTTTGDAIRAAEDYRDSIERLNVELLELQGNVTEAARRQAELDFASVSRRAMVEGDSSTIRTIESLKRARVEQVQLNKAAEDFGLIRDRLQVSEALIQNSVRVGAVTELEGLRRTGDARKAAVVQLQAQYEAMKRIADQSETRTPRMIQQLEQMALEIKQLAAETDLLADKFNSIFEEAFGDFFTDAISGTKSLSQAFKSMADAILKDVNRIIAKDIAQSLFGGGGAGGGFNIGDIFAKMFSGGGGGGSTGFIDFGGFLAGGGAVTAGKSYVVGEHGPELLVAGMSGRVMPNGGGGMGTPIINVNVTTPDIGSFRASRNQIAGEMQAALSASRRNR